MRSSILLVIFAAALPAAANAQGEPVESAIVIDGSVAGKCVVGTPSRPSVRLGTLVDVSGARIGRLAAIPAQEVDLPAVWCNFAGTAIRVSASALLASEEGSPPAGFARAVNFTSTVSNWANPDAAVTTAASVAGMTPTAEAIGGILDQPRFADLRLTLSNFTAPLDSLLIASRYAGMVTITLGPAADRGPAGIP